MAISLGIEVAPLRLPLERRLQTLAALYFSFSFFLFGMLSLSLCIYMLFYANLLHRAILFGYFVWYIWDINSCIRGICSVLRKLQLLLILRNSFFLMGKTHFILVIKRSGVISPEFGMTPCGHIAGGRRNHWIRSWTIWRWFRDFFPIRLLKTAELDPKENYIFGYHPHGIASAGAFCNFATEATGFSEKYPGIVPHLLTLEGQFYFPFHRELVLSCGINSVARESIINILNYKGKGNAAIIVIGGAQEALDAIPDTYRLKINSRRGFVRMAIQNG